VGVIAGAIICTAVTSWSIAVAFTAHGVSDSFASGSCGIAGSLSGLSSAIGGTVVVISFLATACGQWQQE